MRLSKAKSAYDATTTGNGGVVTMIAYPAIKRLSDMIRVFALPILVDNVLMKKAATINPTALLKKIVDTVP